MSFLVLMIAACVVGMWTLRPLAIRPDVEGFVYRVLVGLMLLSVPIMVVGSASLGAVQFGLYLVAGCGLAHELFAAARSRRWPTPERSAHRPWDWIERLSAVAVAGGLLLSLFSALAPATAWDAGVAHLALPSDYVRTGRIMVFEGNAYSAYPHLMHSLYTAAFLRGGETGVLLLSWSFGVLGCLTAFCIGKRIRGRRAGLIAAAILATAPVFFDQAGNATLDLAFAVTVLAALNALIAWRQDKNPAWVGIAAVLAGSGCGIRHTGYVVCVLLSGIMLLTRDRRWLGANLAFIGVTLLTALPWLLRSAVLVNNPFYPFLMNVFPAHGLPDTNITAVASHESIRGVRLHHLVCFPWNIVMHPEWYDGWSKSPGPLVLILGVPGLIVGGKRCRMLGAFCVAGGVLLFFFRQHARYLLPMLLPMMVVAGVAVCRLQRLRKPLNVLLVVTFLYGLALGFAAIHFKIPAALGVVSREEYLTNRIERYPAIVWMNKNVHRNETIFTLDPRSYYFLGSTYQNHEALRLGGVMEQDLEQQLAWLHERGIGYLFYPKAYIEESPGYGQSGLLAMFDGWRRDGAHFALLKRMALDRPRSEGREVVEIYEIRYDP